VQVGALGMAYASNYWRSLNYKPMIDRLEIYLRMVSVLSFRKLYQFESPRLNLGGAINIINLTPDNQ